MSGLVVWVWIGVTLQVHPLGDLSIAPPPRSTFEAPSSSPQPVGRGVDALMAGWELRSSATTSLPDWPLGGASP
eukprot:1329080-Pyramimonas_sp.AAC.1